MSYSYIPQYLLDQMIALYSQPDISSLEICVWFLSVASIYPFMTGVVQQISKATFADEPWGLAWPVTLPYIIAKAVTRRVTERSTLPKARVVND